MPGTECEVYMIYLALNVRFTRCTVQDTFEHAQKWVDELRQQVGGEIAIALAGNKSDMAESHATVTTSVSEVSNSAVALHC